MKLCEIALTPPIVAVIISFGLMFDASATDRYVSSDKSYGAGIVDEEFRYDDLQAAINAAAKNETVWVKDGFVCETGFGGVDSNTKTTNRIYIAKAITVRSESGFVDEKTGKGATIRGAIASPDWCCNTSSVRCVAMTAAATLRGFILEDGASRGYVINTGGGGVAILANNAVVTNCVIRNCFGFNGGGVFASGNGLVADCVITNNIAKAKWQDLSTKNFEGSGGGYYGNGTIRSCLIAGNTGFDVGGGLNYSGGEMSDTKILCNTAGARGGGISFNSGSGSNLYRCLIATNTVSRGNSSVGGAVCAGFGSSSIGRLYDCELVGNSSGSTGGAVWSQDSPAARTGYAVLVGCRVEDNTGGGSGGAIHAGRAFVTNCVIRGNNSSGGSGGAVSVVASGSTDVHVVNTLMEGNRANWGGAVRCGPLSGGRALFINCTAVSNTSVHASSCGGFEGNGGVGATIVNTISWDNIGTKAWDEVLAATNSCFVPQTTPEAVGPGNVSKDPKFVGEGIWPYVVKHASPCRNAGYYDKDDPAWAWMTDKANPASTALNGVPRLQGSAPDMGAFERKTFGLTLLVR